MENEKCYHWGILLRYENKLDGFKQHLYRNWQKPNMGLPQLFQTRAEARFFAKTRFGYIKKNRPDLRAEPYGWKVAKVVKVKCIFEIPELNEIPLTQQ